MFMNAFNSTFTKLDKDYIVTDDEKHLKDIKKDLNEVLNNAIECSKFFHKYYPNKDRHMGHVTKNGIYIQTKDYIVQTMAQTIKTLLFNNKESLGEIKLPTEDGTCTRTFYLLF
jgi:uncharacterized pyridoxamine 5'-phosphate oxidase family protein